MDKLIEKSEQSEQIKEISKINVVEKDFVKDMTMEEYKQYIYDQIAKIPISDSQMNSSFSVYITEEGFEAMKNNPEYEQWVLAILRYDFTFYDAWAYMHGSRYVIHCFGAEKEEYIAHSWSKGANIDTRKAEKSFWKKREERRRRWKKQLEEAQAKKAMWKRVFEREQSQAIYENKMIARRETGIPLHMGYVRTEMAQAYGMYEMYAKICVAARRMMGV
jgi:hypothetical protein